MRRLAFAFVVTAAAFGCGDSSPGDSAASAADGGARSGGSTSSGSLADGGRPSGSSSSSGSSGASSSSGDSGVVLTDCTTVKPTADNTGVPAGTALTVVEGDVTVTEDDAVIDAQDIHGFLIIEADRVKVTRSIVRGTATAATTAIIKIASGTDVLLEDVEVAAAAPSVDVDGVSGSHFTARRLNVHGGVDGMKVGESSVVECSFIHDLVSFASDPNQNGGATHNDAIQILGGTSIRIAYNQLLPAKDQNAAIQLTQDFGVVSDVHIEHNWADGGGCTFNFSHKGQASLGDLHTLGNRFGRNSFFGCPMLKSTKTTLDASGDVYDDDSTAVNIQTHD